jgi:quercetin dioxygenase-like cupin family protein
MEEIVMKPATDGVSPLDPEHADAYRVYVVAGGNHVTVELDRETTGGSLDAIEVLAQPGGGPPPHRHAFGEWFFVREGLLTLSEERNGTVVCTRTIAAGDSVWVPPWTVHGTLNLSADPTRFQVIGQPGLMSAYFAEAGVRVPDELTPPTRPPAGPAQLHELAARWGIEFWTGPIDSTPPAT